MASRLTRADVEQHLKVRLSPGTTVYRSLGRGAWAQLPCVAVFDDPARPVVATLVVDIDEAGTIGCASVTVEGRAGHLIRAGDERLPLSLIVEAAVRWTALMLEGPDLPPGAHAPSAKDIHTDAMGFDAQVRQASRTASSRRPRQRVTPEVLRRVAETYRRPPKGKSRRQAVADRENVGASRANKLIQAAREAGFLRPAPGPRLAGEVEAPRTKSHPKKRSAKR